MASELWCPNPNCKHSRRSHDFTGCGEYLDERGTPCKCRIKHEERDRFTPVNPNK